jgi:hypothetical protein
MIYIFWMSRDVLLPLPGAGNGTTVANAGTRKELRGECLPDTKYIHIYIYGRAFFVIVVVSNFIMCLAILSSKLTGVWTTKWPSLGKGTCGSTFKDVLVVVIVVFVVIVIAIVAAIVPRSWSKRLLLH